MQTRPVPSLFHRRASPEARLFVLATLAAILMLFDARGLLEPARRVLATAIYPFQRAVMLPGDAVRVAYDWRDAAALIRSENESLQRQRIELAQLGARATQLAAENAQLRRLLDIVEPDAVAPVVVVQVLYEPVGAPRRLVFNRGANHGITPGMPVIDEGGVVGQIVRVTPLTAEAALITDGQIAVPVQVQRNGLRLIVFGGNAPARIEVRYLDDAADVRAGDVLVTSGLGGLFPPGLPVARLDVVARDTASGFAHAVGRPLSHPERYRHFLVLQVPVIPLTAADAAETAARQVAEVIDATDTASSGTP